MVNKDEYIINRFVQLVFLAMTVRKAVVLRGRRTAPNISSCEEFLRDDARCDLAVCSLLADISCFSWSKE